MIQKTILISPLTRVFSVAIFAAFLVLTFFTATTSAGNPGGLTVSQIEQKYNLNQADARQLIQDVQNDVQQQCQGRTGSEMQQCVSSKTPTVLQQHASQCINNNKLNDNCSKQLTQQNNSPNQGGAGGGSAANAGNGSNATLSSPGCNGGSCGHQCGADNQNPYTPSIDLGCKGKGNPILDTLFGIIHFLSDGVGLVVIGSIVVGGIQYSASRGDPQATALAINRIRSSVFALIIFIFAYAAINYVIPGFALK